MRVTHRGEEGAPETQQRRLRGRRRRALRVLVVHFKFSGLAVQTLIGQKATGDVLGFRRGGRVEVGGLDAGQANLWLRREQGLAASGEAELVQHSAGGNETSHTGQIDEPEHTGYLKTEQG